MNKSREENEMIEMRLNAIRNGMLTFANINNQEHRDIIEKFLLDDLHNESISEYGKIILVDYYKKLISSGKRTIDDIDEMIDRDLLHD